MLGQQPLWDAMLADQRLQTLVLGGQTVARALEGLEGKAFVGALVGPRRQRRVCQRRPPCAQQELRNADVVRRFAHHRPFGLGID